MKSFIIAGAFAAGAAAQGGAWTQCGGIGWTGATTCISGYTCTFSNNWYSQCLPGTAATTATTAKTTTTSSTKAATTATTLLTSTLTTSSAAATTTAASGKLKWLGVNQSGAEFGTGTYPGTWGKDFTFPDSSAIQVN
jgi:endoglucanase